MKKTLRNVVGVSMIGATLVGVKHIKDAHDEIKFWRSKYEKEMNRRVDAESLAIMLVYHHESLDEREKELDEYHKKHYDLESI